MPDSVEAVAEMDVIVRQGKAFKAATRDGGWLGPIRRSTQGVFSGRVVHHIGDDWPWKAGQAILMLADFARVPRGLSAGASAPVAGHRPRREGRRTGRLPAQ